MNAFSRRRRKDLDELLTSGSRLRGAQESLAGETLRELNDRVRPLVREAARAAVELAAQHDVTLGESAERQVEQTLRAALVDEQAAQAVAAGLLTRALKPVGFGAVDLDGALAVAPSGAAPRASTPGRQQRREAQQAASGALIGLRQADKNLRRQEEHLDELQEVASAAQARAQQLGEQLVQAEREASDAADAAREAPRERDAARTAQRGARRRAERAQQRLDRLSPVMTAPPPGGAGHAGTPGC